MTFTLDNVINSLAGVLKARYPEYPVYSSPNQQGTEFPCFFVFLMPTLSIKDEMNDRCMRNVGIDIVFVQQRNLVDSYSEIYSIAEYLDESLETFTYLDGIGSTDTAIIRTHEREWSIEDEELHYKLHIMQRVSLPREVNYMNEMEENDVRVNR